MRFAIYGTGGFGREIAPLATELFNSWNKAQHPITVSVSEPVVFVDDSEKRPFQVNGIRSISFDELCSDEHRDRNIVVAVGDGRVRERIETRCKAASLKIGTIRSIKSRSLANNEIDEGAVLCDFTIVTANVKIGKSFQCNLNSYVGHDCIIGDYVTLAPGVQINGNTHVGNYVYFGSGAVLIQGTNQNPLAVGEGAIIGMGSVVTKPVDPYTVVVGNPARPIRKIKTDI